MKFFFLFIALSIISLLVTAVIVFLALNRPVDSNVTTEVIFVVNQGEGINSIGKRLEEEGLIRNRYIFIFEVRRLALGPKIQAGDFRLSKTLTPEQIANELTTGTLDVWIKILEGWRAEEIAQALKEKIPTYENTWVLELKKREGYLFPDSYLVPKNADVALVIKILTENFTMKLATLKADMRSNELSLEDSITLASIVEREAQFDEDRPIIAGILLNRLQIGMALQADATVQYALGFQPQEKDWWKKNLTKEDLQINSPYNTYRFPNLPPKPIANPGFASLKAALNPSQTDYLYYLHDSTGKTHYAKTLDEHNANINKYL